MSDIETNLAEILEARYGEDVRQAIHDAIHDCYEDGKAGATDLVARESIEDINTEIDTINGNLKDLILFSTFSAEVTSLSYGATATVTIPFTIPSGYKMLGVVNVVTSGSNILISNRYVSGSNVMAILRNLATSGTYSGTVYAFILFARNI